MKIIKIVYAVLLSFLVPAISLASTSLLIKDNAASSYTMSSSTRDAKQKVTFYSLNLEVMEQLWQGKEDRIVLPVNGSDVEFRQTERLSRDGNITWHGADASGLVIALLTLGKDHLYGQIVGDIGTLSIASDSFSEYVGMRKLDQYHEMEFKDDYLVPPENAEREAVMQNSSATVSEDGTQIDVMVLYTNGMADAYPRDQIKTRIQYFIDQGNLSFSNSAVNTRFNLVYSQQVSYPDTSTGGMDEALNDLTSNVGVFSNIESLRTAYGADQVVLLRRFVSEGCGLAWVLKGNASDARNAYAVVHDGTKTDGSGRYCSDTTYVHEIGHNFGCAHDRANASVSGRYSYSYGYQSPAGNFGTVMSYSCSGNGSGCPRKAYFSNPDISYNGEPTGVLYTAANSSDNARTINQTRVEMANYRTAVAPPTSSAVVQVAAGRSYSALAIKADGTLWAWGDSLGWVWGDPDNQKSKISPVQVGTATNWKYVAAGYSHALAIKNDGTLWSWGLNTYGQLGDGTTEIKYLPVQIGTATDWKTVTAGNEHSLAIKNDGTLWAWGYNAYGQLGDGTTTGKTSPVQIGTAADWKFIIAGEHHTLAIKNNGTLWAWGNNFYAELGQGTREGKSSVPLQIGTDTNWQSAAAGWGHSLAVKDDGTLWGWGYNPSGQLGDGTDILRYSPVQVGAGSSWKSVVAGYENTVAIKTDGTLWGWGQGQFGDRTTTGCWIPLQIGTAADWQFVTAGREHGFGIRADGTLWGWGDNGINQLGAGIYVEKTVPALVGADWKTVTSGAGHSLAIKNNGTLWAWGGNWYGQLGDGTNNNSSVPVQIGTANDWKDVTAGGWHSLALKNDGTLWAWGRSRFGQLGDGTTTNRNAPVQIGIDNDWKTVIAGREHSFAVKDDESFWMWGLNSKGQLGDGTTTNRLSPIKIGTAAGWKTVVPGGDHALALKADGSLWAWGFNFFGQVGDGTTTARTSPVQIGTDTDWQTVIPGEGHSFAVKKDGTLWGWGENEFGQLGDGTATHHYSPVKIATAADDRYPVSDNSNWNGFTIKANGTLWAWGDNSGYNLGDGTTITRYSPVQIGAADDWKSVMPGYPTYAFKKDGTLWGWGGDLGDGTTWLNTPVQVQFPAAGGWTVSPAAGGAGGSISPSTPQTVAIGATISFTISPSAGYMIDFVSGCLGSLNGSIYTTGPVIGNCNVTVVFTPERHTVVPSAGAGGTISPATPQTVIYGGTASFTITPKTNYAIGTVTGCGGSLNGSTYTTGSISGSCTVTATFTLQNDADGDGIDDAWEMQYFGNLTTAGAGTDYDKDGYRDLQEYLNGLDGKTDPQGATYNPTVKNVPGGTGYAGASFLPAVYQILLKKK